MMFYFRFTIPVMKDGSVVSYSPGWCGTRDKCALNEKGLLYNDKERWGIGMAEGDFVPPDVKMLTKTTALNTVSKAVDEEKVYFGDKLLTRWDSKEVIDG